MSDLAAIEAALESAYAFAGATYGWVPPSPDEARAPVFAGGAPATQPGTETLTLDESGVTITDEAGDALS